MEGLLSGIRTGILGSRIYDHMLVELFTIIGIQSQADL